TAILPTQKSTTLNRQDASKLIAAAGFEGPMPEPVTIKAEERWTGKQIFSIVLPKGFNFVSKSNLSSYYKCQDCDKGVMHDCPYDAFVVIKDGILEQGVIDKASIGAEKSESLFIESSRTTGRRRLEGSSTLPTDPWTVTCFYVS